MHHLEMGEAVNRTGSTFFIVASLTIGHAIAADQDSLAQGVGTVTCAEFAQNYLRDPKTAELAFFSWAQGFLTGINIGSKSDVAIVGAMKIQDQQAHIRMYCDAHPLLPYVAAVVDLYNALPKKSNPANSN
jgi:hypothetical protein